MHNVNDKTADIYDMYTSPLKGDEVTSAELQILRDLLKPNSQILDIGGGTGRHAIPLAEAGHNITVVDSSQAMLHRLHTKLKTLHLSGSLETMNESIIHYDPTQGIYDLVMMMWNSFNEIALTDHEAELLLRKSRDALSPTGKIVINIDDISKFNLSSLEFTTEEPVGDKIYVQSWEVIKFDPDTNTTISRETIDVRDETGKSLRKEQSDITQRWWTAPAIERMATALGMVMQRKTITQNDELYLILSRA